MNKLIYRKNVLIIWGILEVILSIICVVMMKLKAPYTPQGFLIDQNFLSNLVQYKYYDALQDTAAGLIALTGLGFVLFIIEFVRVRRNPAKSFNEKWFFAGVLFAPLVGIIIFTTPINKNLSIKSDQPAFVQREFIIDKQASESKRSHTYTFVFNSGTKVDVSKDEYIVTPLGMEYFIVYQGDLDIGFYPTDKYQLKVK
ncbi:MAG: hypothetical protein MJZ25_08055 [Fibrobacter sp.]|nr:hypothetical protein [Fibrobacter sp.]